MKFVGLRLEKSQAVEPVKEEPKKADVKEPLATEKPKATGSKKPVKK